jgi:aldose 1-epimerase
MKDRLCFLSFAACVEPNLDKLAPHFLTVHPPQDCGPSECTSRRLFPVPGNDVASGGPRFLWLVAALLLLATGCRSSPGARREQLPSSQSKAVAVPRIGGEPVITLARQATGQGKKPEFLSVTLLPGRGMNTFQITANIPGRGEIALLDSPSLDAAAKRLTGTGRDKDGNASFTFGGAFLVPYPNRVLGVLSADGQSITTSWRGHQLKLPANGRGPRKFAVHGLILNARAEDLQLHKTADGQTATAVIHAGNFAGHWVSNTDLSFAIALVANAIEVTVSAKNVGTVWEPMAIGWHPYFVIPSGDRSQARLHVPALMTAVANDGIPTGRLSPVAGKVYDFRRPRGVPLENHALDTSFSHFLRTDGAVGVSLTDPKYNYGIRVEGLSPEIKAVQVYSPEGKQFVAIEDQFNYVDPFGKEWKGMNTGVVPLRPGQSVSWRVRLELFTPEPGN